MHGSFARSANVFKCKTLIEVTVPDTLVTLVKRGLVMQFLTLHVHMEEEESSSTTCQKQRRLKQFKHTET